MVNVLPVAEFLDFFSTMLERRYGLPGASMHDPLAVTALVHPDLSHFEPMRVDTELQGMHTYGMIVYDRRHLSPTDNNALPLRAPLTEANAQVAVDVDASRFWDHFLKVLGTYP